MPFITATINDSTDGKITPTLNGINLFGVGPFYGQYGTGVTVANSTTETSILFNQAAATNNQLSAPTASAAVSPINLSSDPTGKNPIASLYLPGTGTANIPFASMGSLVSGTIFEGCFYGVVGITSTPTLEIKLVLRNPTTGSVVYTLADTATTFSPAAGGLQIRPNFCVTKMGSSGTIVATVMAVGGGTIYQFTPNSTTVNTNNSYIIDLTATWSAQSSSNTITIYYGSFEAIC